MLAIAGQLNFRSTTEYCLFYWVFVKNELL